MKRFFAIALLLVFTSYTFGIGKTGIFCDENSHLIDSTIVVTCCDKHDTLQKDCEHYQAIQKQEEVEHTEETIFTPTIIGFIQSFALYFTSKDDSFQEPKQNDSSSPALFSNLLSWLKSLIF